MGYSKRKKQKSGSNVATLPIVAIAGVALVAAIVFRFKFSTKEPDADKDTHCKSEVQEQVVKQKYKRILGVELGSDYEYCQSEYDAYKTFYSGYYFSWKVEECLKCKTGFDFLEPNFFDASTKLILHGEELKKVFGVLVIIHCKQGTEQKTALEIRDIFLKKYECTGNSGVTLAKKAEEFSPTAGGRHEKFEYSLQADEFYAEIVGVTAENEIQVEGFERAKFDGFVALLVVHPDFESFVEQDHELIQSNKVKMDKKAKRDNYNSL